MNGYKVSKTIVVIILILNIGSLMLHIATDINYLVIIMGVQIYAYLDLKSDIRKGK